MDRFQLVSILNAFYVSFYEWGKGKAKTVDHLLNEVNSGEAVLKEEDGVLYRTINVAALNVFYKDCGRLLCLKEEKQVFNDGRERKRVLQFSLYEKVKPNEHGRDAILRLLREELGIAEELTPIPKGNIAEMRSSESFPNLMTKYAFDLWEVFLPPHLYKPDGYVEVQLDKKSYFTWMLS